MHALEFDHVTKRYGDTAVVDDLSFTARPGRVTGFLGPNGSGKTTSMKVLLDLAKAQQGHATIGGRRYRDLPDPTRTVGVALEADAFHPGRSGRQHLRVLADSAGIETRRVDEVLDIVGLEEARERRVGAYSLGMRQRLGLAGALLGDPPVLILDEPGNGLDPQGILQLRDLLRTSADRGATVFVSGHLLGEIEHLADDVVVLHHGRLVTSGALADLQHSDVAVRANEPTTLSSVLLRAGAEVSMLEDGALSVRGLSLSEIGERAFAAGVVLHELTQREGSLEELFMRWTEESTP
ncbi:ABC transporter ATP-binding protein [Nocardioides pacificus]